MSLPIPGAYTATVSGNGLVIEDSENILGVHDDNNTVIDLSPPGKTATVHVVKIDIYSVNSIDGTLKVNCEATPPMYFTEYEHMLNGTNISHGACDLNVGKFNFTINQGLFTESNNTFEVKMKTESGHWSSASFTAERSPHSKDSSTEIVSAYFIADGVGLKLFNHKAGDGWHTLHYSVPQSGRTFHFGTSGVSLFMGNHYGNITSWGEEHKYVNSAGTTGLLTMSPPSAPYIGASQTAYQDSRSNLWLAMNELKGVFTVSSLIYDTGNGLALATPILNASIEIILN